MTKIEKPLVRETAALVWGDRLVVELLPKSLIIRRKGKTGGVQVSYERIYNEALKLEARRKP